MSDPIVKGNTLHTDLLVKNDLGVLTDPATLTLTVKTPSNVAVVHTYPTVAITKTSTGTYYGEFVLTEIGVWEYEWTTTTPARVSGGEVYVESDPVSSSPSTNTVADHTKFWLGGENWLVLANSPNFGISHIILGIENVKRRVLTSPPVPSGESALNGNVLTYLGLLCALELIPAARDCWANKIITRSTGNDPSEITTYTDRSNRITDLQKDLLLRQGGLYKAAKPFLDVVLNVPVSVAAIGETDDLKVTEDPRLFPPLISFPYPRDYVPYVWPR